MDAFGGEIVDALNAGVADGEKVEFHCFGSRSFGKHDRVAVTEHPFVPFDDWRGLYGRFKSFDLGVAVNPLDETDEFCKCKSELKFVETAAMGVPLITSRVPPYTEFLKEGENGFFASMPKEFADKVLMVMRDEAMSRKVSENAYRTVVEDYDVTKNALKFLEDLDEARKKVAR